MPEPLLLSGPPDGLRANVSLENASDKRVSVRGLVLRRDGADDLAVRFGAILPPASTTAVPLSIALPQTTPPGEYDALIEIGGQSRQVRLQVDPKISARLTPDQILAPPGTSRIGLRIVNQGNVDIPLAAVTRARTTDDGPDFGADVTLDLGQAVVLSPGSTLELTGTLTVPDDLDPTRRHEAPVPVGVCDLIVIVLPRDPDQPPSTIPTARARTRKSGPRKATRPAARRAP